MLAKNVTATLVIRALRGDPDSFKKLVQAHLRAAYSVALAILGRPADAEDIAQDSFLIAFERLDTCREPERFAGWLLQIVRNQARNALVSRRLRDQTASIGQAPWRVMTRSGRSEMLWMARLKAR